MHNMNDEIWKNGIIIPYNVWQFRSKSCTIASSPLTDRHVDRGNNQLAYSKLFL